jgi:hypothetical protein
MQSVSFLDLQNIALSTLHKQLTSEGVLVVTMNHKPFAALIDLADENAQDILLLTSRLRAQMATRSIRDQALKDGKDKTTLKEVNALIKKTRMERKRGKQIY